jgi:phage terminase small subunit
MAARKLTPKQEQFVKEYLVDLDATAAARRSGYSEKTVGQIGYQLLQKTSIAEAIRVAKSERSRRTGVTADKVLRELALVGFSDIGNVLDFSGDNLSLRAAGDIARHHRRTLSSVKVKRYTEGHGDDAREVETIEFKLWDKMSALEKIGKHIGMFPGKVRVEVTGKDGSAIEHGHDHRHSLDRISERFLAALAEDAGCEEGDHSGRNGRPQPVHTDGSP